jgi:hypothetical protein
LLAAGHKRQPVLGRELNEDRSVRVEKRLNNHRLRIHLGHGRIGAFELIGIADQYRL